MWGEERSSITSSSHSHDWSESTITTHDRHDRDDLDLQLRRE
jgi:hypothetical protein